MLFLIREKNNAPGPDKIPIEFYQYLWEFVKHDIMTFFDCFHANTLDIQRLNYVIITFFPKTSEANKIQ
jgi:hypothetical protein